MRLLLLVVTVGLLLSASGGAVAAGSQKWYLGGDNTLTAYRQTIPPAPDNPSFNIVAVAEHETRIWYANEAAILDINFGTGAFSYSLRVSRDVVGTFRIAVGHGVPTAETFTQHASSALITGVAGQRVYTGTIDVNQFVVPEGQSLAFAVVNPGDPGGKAVRVVIGDSDSWLASTANDPGYPTPELATFALAAVGLTVAVAVLRRR